MVVSSVAVAKSSREGNPTERLWSDLIRRVAQADQGALAELYDRTSPLVFGLVLRIVGDRPTAEDVTLEVYTQVWRQASQYIAERGSPSSWLLMLARSRAIDCLRSRSRRNQEREEPLEAAAELAEASPDPEATTIEADRQAVIRDALATLAPEQRQAIELAFFSGMSHSEIAISLGQPLGTIKTRVRLGMLRLREVLKPYVGAL